MLLVFYIESRRKMEKLKTRDEVSSNDKWNIEAIYPNQEAFEKDFEKLEQEIESLASKSKTFTKDASSFASFFQQDEEISILLENIYIYAQCRNDEDKTNSTYQELQAKAENIYAEYREKTAFVVPSILKMDQSVVDEYMKQEDYLKDYQYFFTTIFEKKEHILKEETEKVLSAYSPVFSSSDATYSYLTNADLEFEDILDENGKTSPLDEAHYSTYIRSKNRNVRKEAFTKLHEGYGKVKNTLTATYRTTVDYDSITSRLRNYKSSIEMYLKPKSIPVELYENLIKVVHENLDTLYQYYDLKKEILKLDEFHLYDSYIPIIEKSSKEYTFDEAETIVKNALSVYGEEYSKKLEEAFQNRWIDKYPNKGKKTGAYSNGGYQTIPYILLNFTNTYHDVSTLAHELGHSMHTYYTNKNNSFVTANYPIFLAEIASTTNELLLSHFMYQNTNNKEEKLNLLNEKLELFKATIFRQTMFAEFEYLAHQYVDNKNILTAEYLCNTYYELNKKYFGNHVVVDDVIKYEWLRIPHFYTPFYVYQYSTSLAISCYVAKNIIENKDGFKEKYFEFLSSGGRDYPLEVLKIIDIDLKDTKVFESAMIEFKDTLEEFKRVYYEK